MKKSEKTATFVIICVAILIGSYGIGFCIREIRFSKAKAALSKETQGHILSTPALESQETVYSRNQRTLNERTTNRGDMSGTGFWGRTGGGMQNLSEEEIAAMQEQRSGHGGRGGGGRDVLAVEDSAIREQLINRIMVITKKMLMITMNKVNIVACRIQDMPD